MLPDTNAVKFCDIFLRYIWQFFGLPTQRISKMQPSQDSFEYFKSLHKLVQEQNRIPTRQNSYMTEFRNYGQTYFKILSGVLIYYLFFSGCYKNSIETQFSLKSKPFTFYVLQFLGLQSTLKWSPEGNNLLFDQMYQNRLVNFKQDYFRNLWYRPKALFWG